VTKDDGENDSGCCRGSADAGLAVKKDGPRVRPHVVCEANQPVDILFRRSPFGLEQRIVELQT